jgi:polysaccharide deacetylase 2 family uncharacterized protein YibQ
MVRWLTTGFLAGWAGIGRFWAILACVFGLVVGTLWLLGPPPIMRVDKPASAPAGGVAGASGPPTAPRDAASQVKPGRADPGPIRDVDPALTERVPGNPELRPPRIAQDGRRSHQVYAAGFPDSPRRPKVGLIIAGFGLNEAESLRAARDLPGGVTLALSPYAADPERAMTAARAGGHETLLAIPMEPSQFPLSDPGPRALLTSLPPERNLERLLEVLGRAGGYVGATSALGAMRGERFSGMSDQLDAVLRELDQRGLLFVDARPGTPPSALAWTRAIDLVVDEITSADALDQRLEALSRLALDRGSALGLVTAPRPVTLTRIEAWTNGLGNRGLALAPVSALVNPPAKPE